jgi:hypothetical protein
MFTSGQPPGSHGAALKSGRSSTVPVLDGNVGVSFAKRGVMMAISPAAHHRRVRMVASETTFDATSHQQRRAVRLVASASTGAEDCAALLAVLGLNAADGVLDENTDREL